MCGIHNQSLPLDRESLVCVSVFVSVFVGLPTVTSVGISDVRWLWLWNSHGCVEGHLGKGGEPGMSFLVTLTGAWV